MATNSLKVATFNVSMESENYLPRGAALQPELLSQLLAQGKHPQIQNIASIIQRVRPDVLLLNEFDYIAQPEHGVQLFIRNYLQKALNGQEPIDYPYFYYSTVNTGQPSGFDLDNDGKASGTGADAWGFGLYPGQYGMMVLSRYPINQNQSRSFQQFKWKDMPGYLKTTKADGSDWYSADTWQQMPLSSKSHWDLLIDVKGTPVHLLISHPTPPVFDGEEDRNGKRNHDEVRFWVDYLSGDKANYIYDDKGTKGGLAEQQRFVVLGDLNSSAVEGDSYKDAIRGLIGHSRISGDFIPHSSGGKANSPANPLGQYHTAAWRMRADYVLPSSYGFAIKDGGVFWPVKGEALDFTVADRESSSDHRMVWLELEITD
ncbi:endonuclease/exonuclease/phosphatase family protein [Rheinheimera marina]|uniref:Endonuclease/exonuclease/phosphatase family protein n=1 Tax=Rheinheimera marina TaxID=1774958 RepID=A0ABV9JLX0_9GAMM